MATNWKDPNIHQLKMYKYIMEYPYSEILHNRGKEQILLHTT